ncbi:OLC1v1030578C2 [Oldenlandia corymbosa var. corymbosa]|uniref:OLC1v1030578C2 n=1 Tax=Oldenlandia corymbosa var. corymbosa TaxID=529605 RepID=A0AAV1CJC1_OLDCO|nr:OLC1v1030578C2 [Oldenlandia corymbosa var. corymbosa]
MLKRQDSLLSSSYLRTPPPPPSKTTENRHAKLTGCFPAIFKLISSKYNNRKKLLTFGKKLKTPRNVVSTPTTETESFRLSTADNSADSVLKEEDIKNDIKEEDRDLESRKLTGDVTPRSPMLPPEIRLMAGNAVPAVPERPALVARLMGLEDDHQPGSKTIKKDDEEEKRRRLLEALEKCNEDLVSLKKVIMAVQLVEDKHNKKSAPSEIFQLPRPTTPDSDDSDGDDVVDYVGGRSPPPFRRYNYAANLHHNDLGFGFGSIDLGVNL